MNRLLEPHRLSGATPSIPTAGPVTVAIGTRNAAVPQRILGRDLFSWQTYTGLMTAPATSRRGRWMRRGEGTVIGHDRKALLQRGITFRSRLFRAHGHTADVDAVVWATGFEQDHTWVHIPDAPDGARLRHDGGLTPVDCLYVLGLPWQRTAGWALPSGQHSLDTSAFDPTAGCPSWPRQSAGYDSRSAVFCA